jgi:hypothetical protein
MIRRLGRLGRGCDFRASWERVSTICCFFVQTTYGGKFMPSDTQAAPVSKTSLWAGRIITTLVVLFLLFDAVAKLMRIAPVLAAFTQLGFSTSLAVPIGAVLLFCTILYAIPPTSILGAILLAAYLGGATVTHLRAGQPFYFPIIFGVLVWGGLYLREPRLRALIPLRSPQALLVSLF